MLGGGRLGAAQDGANASDKLTRVEWLRQIVVGSHLEADDAVDVLAFRRQHDDRHARRGAKTAANRKTVLARHHEVEDDEIRIAVARAETVERRAAVADVDAEPLPLQVALHQVADLGVVLDDENAGAVAHGT